MKIELDGLQHASLMVMLNIELRNLKLTSNYATALNGMFKQLAGRDHESMAHRNET